MYSKNLCIYIYMNKFSFYLKLFFFFFCYLSLHRCSTKLSCVPNELFTNLRIQKYGFFTGTKHVRKTLSHLYNLILQTEYQTKASSWCHLPKNFRPSLPEMAPGNFSPFSDTVTRKWQTSGLHFRRGDGRCSPCHRSHLPKNRKPEMECNGSVHWSRSCSTENVRCACHMHLH